MRSKTVAAMFIGPAACAAAEAASYALVRPAAASGSRALVLIPIALGALIAALGLLLSARHVREDAAPGVDRFLAVAGLAVNAFFFLVVVVGFGLPAIVLHPTD
jgi:hypothetical protein